MINKIEILYLYNELFIETFLVSRGTTGYRGAKKNTWSISNRKREVAVIGKLKGAKQGQVD